MYKDLQIISTKCDSNDSPLEVFFERSDEKLRGTPLPKKIYV